MTEPLPQAVQDVETQPESEIEVRDFGKSAKGFSFNVIQWNDLDAAIKRYGKEIILELVNSALANAIRAKAKNSLPLFEDKNATKLAWAALIQQGKTTLFSKEQALEFIPGIRPQSSQALLKKAKEAKKAGNNELAKTFLKQVLALIENESSELEQY